MNQNYNNEQNNKIKPQFEMLNGLLTKRAPGFQEGIRKPRDTRYKEPRSPIEPRQPRLASVCESP